MSSEKNINIFENFGEIQGEEKDVLVYVKDGKTYLLDPNLEFVKDAVIIDNVAGKEYQTVLGVDGKLYDLKTELTYPKGFVNSGIKYISNNIDSDNTNVLVEYKNGSIVMFNYKTGEVILTNSNETSNLEGVNIEGISLIDFAKGSISSLIDKAKDILGFDKYEGSAIKLEQSYGDGLEIEKFVEEKYLQENKVNPYNSENSLQTMYNSETNQYEVYSVDEIINGTSKEVISETEKLKEELGISNLSTYVNSASQIKISINSILLFAAIVIGIYFAIYKLANRKES